MCKSSFDQSRRIIPEEPLVFIKECLRSSRILWTYHVNMRMESRSISRGVILQSIDTLEIIEDYPEDKYLPSYLLYGCYRQEAFHVMIAADVKGDSVRVVTAYRPDHGEWESDLRTRRRA
jgi:hypothetical protein